MSEPVSAATHTAAEHAQAARAGLEPHGHAWDEADDEQCPTCHRLYVANWSIGWLCARAAAADTLANALREVEWNGYAYIGLDPCPSCGQELRHADDCIVAAALAAYDAATGDDT